MELSVLWCFKVNYPCKYLRKLFNFFSQWNGEKGNFIENTKISITEQSKLRKVVWNLYLVLVSLWTRIISYNMIPWIIQKQIKNKMYLSFTVLVYANIGSAKIKIKHIHGKKLNSETRKKIRLIVCSISAQFFGARSYKLLHEQAKVPRYGCVIYVWWPFRWFRVLL